MMKLPRIEKTRHGGVGDTTFESNLFRVVHWKLSNGTRTTLIYITANDEEKEINFDGWVELANNTDCLAQLTGIEIIKIIQSETEKAYAAGRLSKAPEIKACLFDE